MVSGSSSQAASDGVALPCWLGVMRMGSAGSCAGASGCAAGSCVTGWAGSGVCCGEDCRVQAAAVKSKKAASEAARNFFMACSSYM